MFYSKTFSPETPLVLKSDYVQVLTIQQIQLKNGMPKIKDTNPIEIKLQHQNNEYTICTLHLNKYETYDCNIILRIGSTVNEEYKLLATTKNKSNIKIIINGFIDFEEDITGTRKSAYLTQILK